MLIIPQNITREGLKAYHDKRILKRKFQRGQSLLLFNSRLKLFPGKLKSKWSDPFVIKEIKPYGTIEFQDPSSKRSWIVSGQRLKSYIGGDLCTLTKKVESVDPL